MTAAVVLSGLCVAGASLAGPDRPGAVVLLDPLDRASEPLWARQDDSAAGRAVPDARLDAGARERSPAVAGILSAVVPGAGQLYNGNRIGFLFMGVEVASWVAYFSLHDTGKQEERDYRRFADSHWTFERYRDTAFEECPAEGHSDFGIQDSTLVLLYDTRRKDYYEDIGKLLIYSCGWDSQDNREIYRGMRANSNRFLRNARYATTLVFLNHLVSALHAARGAAAHNARLPGGAELGFEIYPGLADPSAELALIRRF